MSRGIILWNYKKVPYTRKIANFQKYIQGTGDSLYKWVVRLCVYTSVWRCSRVCTGGSPLSLYNIVKFFY